ncbi:hypothetical protein V5O48_017726, partial [Marasmius crinis-equi]
MSDNHRRSSTGFFSSIFRSLTGLVQDQPRQNTVNDNNNEPHDQHDQFGSSAGAPSHDVEMTANDNEVATHIARSNNAQKNDDDDLPTLEDVSDTEESSADELEMLRAPSVPPSLPPSSTTSNVSSHASSPVPASFRRGQRRVRVEDEDDGDLARDRRHPSRRAADTSRSALPSAATTRNESPLNNSTRSSSNSDAQNNHTFLHRFRPFSRSSTPDSSSSSSASRGAASPHIHFFHRHSQRSNGHGQTRHRQEGSGGGVPGLGSAADNARRARSPEGSVFNASSQSSSTPRPAATSQSGTFGGSFAGSTTRSQPSMPRRQPHRHSDHHHHPPHHLGDGFFPDTPLPFAALPTLLRSFGVTTNGYSDTGSGNMPRHASAGGDGAAPTNTNSDGSRDANQPPHMFTADFGGMGPDGGPNAGNAGNFFAFPFGGDFDFFDHPLFSLNEERERDDSSRGRQIVDGLESVDVGLVKRLERANQTLGEEDGSNCAVCWESLVDGVVADWGTNASAPAELSSTQTTANVGPTPSTDSSSTSPAESREAQQNNESTKKIVALPCSHLFHADCLLPWFSRPMQTTCPVCRFDVDPDHRIWGQRERRGMPMGMGMGFFGGPMGPMDHDHEHGRDQGVLADLMALAALSRLARPREQDRNDATPGQTPPMNTPNAATNGVNPERNSANTNTDRGEDDPLQRIAERVVRQWLGSGNSPLAGGGQEGQNQPRVRVVNSENGGGLQIHVDMSGTGDENGPAPPFTNPSVNANANNATPDTFANGVDASRAGNDDDRRRGPTFSIGFDMIFGPPPGPGVNPPPGFFPIGFPFDEPRTFTDNDRPTPSNSNTTSFRGNDDTQRRHPEPHHHHHHHHHRPRPPNVDADGDVIMEFEHIIHYSGDTERPRQRNGGAEQASPSPHGPNAARSPPVSHERRRSSYPPFNIHPDGRSESRRASLNSDFLADRPGVRVFTGTATSMGDMMRQIDEHLDSHRHGPTSTPVPTPPPQARPEQTPRTRSPTAVLPPWMSQESLVETSNTQSGAPSGSGSQQEQQPTHAAAAAPSPTTRSAETTTPTSQPTSPHPQPFSQPQTTQNNDPNSMPFTEFLRSWNSERTESPLPPLPRVPRPPVPASDERPPPPPFSTSRPPPRPAPHMPRRTPRPAPPSRDNETKWAPPSAPGPTLRERVEKKEREAGFRCWDMSCGVGPSDEEPLVDTNTRKRKQVHVKKPSSLTKGKGKATETTEGVEKSSDEDVCEHTFHPSCLISASR